MVFARIAIVVACLWCLTACTVTPPIVMNVPTSTVGSSAIPTPSASPTTVESLVPTRTPRPTITPQPTETPIPQVEWLPLDWTWEWDLNAVSECGYPLIARDGDGKAVSLPTIVGISLRPKETPLLIACNGTRDNVSLIDHSNERITPIQGESTHFYQFFSFTPSPEGNKIAIYGYENNNATNTQAIYTVDTMTGEIQYLFKIPVFESNPTYTWDYAIPIAWREDGLYFETPLSGISVLWRAALRETEWEVQELFRREGAGDTIYEYRMSRTSPYIAYVEGIDSGNNPVDLHLLDLVTGENQIIDNGARYEGLTFNPEGNELYYYRFSESSEEVVAVYQIETGTMTFAEDDPLRSFDFVAYNAPIPDRFYRSGFLYNP